MTRTIETLIDQARRRAKRRRRIYSAASAFLLLVGAAAFVVSVAGTDSRTAPPAAVPRPADRFVVHAGMTNVPLRRSQPVLSPDGRKIAFTGPKGIFVINTGGTGLQRLTRGLLPPSTGGWKVGVQP